MSRGPKAIGLAAVAGMLGATLTACANKANEHTSLVGLGEGGFGMGASRFDAGLGDAWPPPKADGGARPARTARARIVHGIPNLGPLRTCFDPDYVADDPATVSNEEQFGKLPPADLAITTLYGQATDYSAFSAEARGAFTFHDANAEVPCSSESLAAVLPLPFAGRYFDATSALGDAELTALGLATTLDPNNPITLLGAGVALDRSAFRDQVKAQYLTQHPGEEEAAQQRANERWSALLAARGPLFVIARELPIAPLPGAFTLHLAHLVADIAPDATEPSDAVRVCVTQGTTERAALPVAKIAGVRFRTRARLGEDFPAGVMYRFRVFARARLDAEANGCATTGLTPLAQLTADAATFQPGRSYTLLLMGAYDPNRLCYSGELTGTIGGCAGRTLQEVEAKLVLVADD